MHEIKKATYQEEGGLSLVYVYVVPDEDFPPPQNLYSESREIEIVIDRERGSGRILGIEIVTGTEPHGNLPSS